MPLFFYKGSDQKGKKVSGMVAAASRTQAHQKLRERHVFPTDIKEDLGSNTSHVGGDDLAYVVMQLAALLKSGIPMDEALSSLAESADNAKMRRALARVQVRLREGETLSGAMTEDAIFPPMMVRMVSAGEEAGQPGEILDRYAVFMQNEIEHTRALHSALAYPCVLVGLASILLVALVMFLTPIIKDMYDSTGSELPTITKFMVGLGDFLHNWGFITLIAGAVVIFLIYKSTSQLAKDRLKLRLPIFGNMVKAGLMARWARTLAMLQGAGVPLLRSLQMSREVLDNEVLTKELRKVEIDVERGAGISAAISRVYLIPPLLQQFLKTGERTGSIEPMLNSAASFYERELARSRTTLIRWLEPCLIVFMGIIVGLLVISALLPLSELSAKL